MSIPFDISGATATSLSLNFSLQGFLDRAPDLTVRQSLELMRPHMPELWLKSSVFDNMLDANSWEMEQIHVAYLEDPQLKLAVRIYTLEHPYPVHSKFNLPFLDKARSPTLLEPYAPYAKLLLRATHALMKQPQYLYEGPGHRLLRI
jgi:hypothetical protein